MKIKYLVLCLVISIMCTGCETPDIDMSSIESLISKLPWLNKEEIPVYNADILSYDEIVETFNDAVYAKYADIIGETIPGERIVRKAEGSSGSEYSIYTFDDVGYTHEYYIFTFDLNTYATNKTERVKELNIEEDTLECDEPYRAIHFYQPYTTMGSNSYNFFKESIDNEVAVEQAKHKKSDIVDYAIDEVGRVLTVVGSLDEYVPPDPVLVQDDEGYTLRPTSKEYFDYVKQLDGTYKITGYHGEGGTRLVIPEELDGVAVTAIGELEPVSDITAVYVPGCVKKLVNSFRNWSDLNRLDLGDGVESIDTYTIAGTNVINLSFPTSVTYVGDEFYMNTNISDYTIPEGMTTLGKMFSGCDVQQIIIPEHIEVIGEGAFEGCTELNTVFILDGVKRIEARAFADCPNLQAISVPSSVEFIDEDFCGDYFNDIDVLLVTVKGSYADAFAKRNKLNYANQEEEEN